MRRTFLSHFVEIGDNGPSWVQVAVGTWRLVALGSAAIALGLVCTFWFMGYGMALVVLGCVVPIWLARELGSRPTSTFAAGTAVYGLALGAWLLLKADIGAARVIGAMAAMIPGAISALAWWNLRGGNEVAPESGPT